MDLCRFLHEDLICGVIFDPSRTYWCNPKPELNAKYTELLGIPGFGSVTALTVLLELGDYTRFHGWKQMAKFCGVVPLEEDTGNDIGKRHINRFSNPNLRYALLPGRWCSYWAPSPATRRDQLPRHCRILRSLLTPSAYGNHFKSAMIKVAQKMTGSSISF